MTNPEAAAPTDMEAALRDAQAAVKAAPGWIAPESVLRLARCLLASSAEVAALREQVARLLADVEQQTCRLAAVSTVAMGYANPDTIHGDYKSAALSDMLRAIAAARADERARAERDIAALLERRRHITATSANVADILASRYPKADPGALPKSGAVERDPDDDSAWPLPEGQWALINSREWCVVHTNGDTTFCYGGTGILSGRVTPLHPSTEPTIRARNLAARAARTKAAPKDASHG